MIDELRYLIDLQRNLERQNFINEEFENPSIIKELKEPYESIEKEKREREKNIKEIEEKISLIEKEINEKREEIKNFRHNLQLVRSQKEYSQILNSIDSVQKILSLKEEEVLNLMENLEREKKEIEEKKIKWEPIEREYKDALEKWNELKKKYEEELEALKLDEKIIKTKLKKEFLNLFQRIYQLRKGQAVVPVQNGSCSGCHIIIRPQQLADIKLGNEIIQCDQCQRILYLE